MKVLLQRVSSAKVEIGGETVGAVGPGFMALVGCRTGDVPEDADRLAAKTAALRVFEDAEGRMNRSLGDTGGAVLAISQFTLYADTRKGNRPSFVEAGSGDAARVLYDRFCADLRSLLGPARVATGRFGADMRVSLVNEGPCTVELRSEVAREPSASPRPRLPLPALELVPVNSPEREARALKIAREAWPPTYAGIIPEAQVPYMIGRMYSPETIRSDTAAGSPFFLVQADGADAGVCSFDLSKRGEGGSAELHKLYTLPAWWGRGMGEALLGEICRRLAAAGARSVWLRVNKRNERAQKAYRAAGFRRERGLCEDIGGGFVMDDWVYSKTLFPEGRDVPQT